MSDSVLNRMLYFGCLHPDIYTIKTTLHNFRGPKIYRTMEVQGSTSLNELAFHITKSFNFDFDHCFGFFSNIKDKDDSLEAYSSFLDSPQDPAPECGPRCRIYKGTEAVAVKEVFEPSKRMLFYFDYGDSWQFIVECQQLKRRKPDVVYPRVTAIKGEAPKQYQVCSDSEEEEQEEEIDNAPAPPPS